MENEYESFDSVEYVKKQPLWAFCLLSFFTFGFYTIYWFYKNWRFFKELYGLDVYPVWRAIFTIFFVHVLLERINDLAIEKGHSGISANAYATAYILLAFAQRLLERILPDSQALFVLLLMPFLFLVPSVNQLNYIYEQAHPNEYLPPFSAGEITALLLGGILIVLGVAGTWMGAI